MFKALAYTVHVIHVSTFNGHDILQNHENSVNYTRDMRDQNLKTLSYPFSCTKFMRFHIRFSHKLLHRESLTVKGHEND